eukprot:GSChrysophyteH1.ASY1.ANO1.3107.1 assembled CDS
MRTTDSAPVQGDDLIDEHATGHERVMKVVRRKSKLQQYLIESKDDDAAIALLSQGARYSAERNFLAFVLRHVQGSLKDALYSLVKSQHPETPVLKAHKDASSFRYFEEIRP